MSLKANGQAVAVCGVSLEDPCHAYADHAYPIDYSQRDLLLDLVRRERIDYLCPSCNDYSYLSCAWVAEQCGLPGYDSYETALILHRKSDFRRFLEKHGLPAPRAFSVSDTLHVDDKELVFPVLAKPVDSFSGRGMTKIMQAEDLREAVEAAVGSSRTRGALLEEFVEGSLHSHSAFIRDGNFVFDTFVDEYCTVYPYQVDCSNAPSALPQAVQKSVRECIREIVTLLRLHDGLLHTQFITNEDGICIIECMRRCPGDLYYRLVELSTGINGHDLYVQPFIGKALPRSVNSVALNYWARHTISVANSTLVFSLSHRIPGSDVQYVPLKGSGMVLDPAPFDKLGILFAAFTNLDDLLQHTPRFADYIDIQSIGRIPS